MASLVRESIQNALDARHGEKPVTVHFRLHEAAYDSTGADRYLGRLRPHLDALKPVVRWPIDRHSTVMRWLVYEDFNTTGLLGDPEIVDDDQIRQGRKEDFYWFWRNVGRSAKTGEKLGRWGLGKTVFPASSAINCIIGLTRRVDDGQHFLMGQAVLKTHSLDDQRFLPYGLLCDPDRMRDCPLPLVGPSHAADVSRVFRLQRGNESGLSLVVPFVREFITARAIAKAVCTHFFARVLRHELVVETSDVRNAPIRIDGQSIDTVIANLKESDPEGGGREWAPPLDLARAAIARSKADTFDAELAPAGAQGTANWSKDLIPKGVAASLAEKAATVGELVAVRVPLILVRRGGTKVPTTFEIYLRRRPDRAGQAWHVRDGMTITAVSTARPAIGDLDGLLVVNDAELSSFLGDAEGPAHVEWNPKELRLERNWETYDRRVRFVANAIGKLADLLKDAKPKIASLALAKVFSVSVPRGPAEDSETNPTKPGVPPQPTPDWYTINGRQAGLTVRSTPNVVRPEGTGLRVSVAYDVSSGDPFKTWSTFDFVLDNKLGRMVRVTGDNVIADPVAGNILDIRITADPFRLSIVGFDVNRDVVVRAEPIVVDPGTPSAGNTSRLDG